jgi:hypothetical protein
MNLLDLITGAGTGGLLGGALALANTWLSARIRREDRAHELELLRTQGALRASGEEMAAFRASQESALADAHGVTYPWVEAVRKLTRPALTFGLIAAALATNGKPLGPDFLLLAGTAVGWWFGSRPTLGRQSTK